MADQRPTFSRIDHIAWTVPDVAAAAEFYCKVVGFRELYRMGPFDAAELPRSASGKDWTESHINVVGARLSIVMLQLGDASLFELFEYEKPLDRRTTPPRNYDIGGYHLGLKVSDMEAACAYLKEHGCVPAEEAIVLDVGPTAGSRVWYVLDPWGNQLELIEYTRQAYMDALETAS